ncbi:hypothetical protein HDU96_000562, partial [Phlyctochytrium bullatum]
LFHDAVELTTLSYFRGVHVSDVVETCTLLRKAEASLAAEGPPRRVDPLADTSPTALLGIVDSLLIDFPNWNGILPRFKKYDDVVFHRDCPHELFPNDASKAAAAIRNPVTEFQRFVDDARNQALNSGGCPSPNDFRYNYELFKACSAVLPFLDHAINQAFAGEKSGRKDLSYEAQILLYSVAVPPAFTVLPESRGIFTFSSDVKYEKHPENSPSNPAVDDDGDVIILDRPPLHQTCAAAPTASSSKSAAAADPSISTADSRRRYNQAPATVSRAEKTPPPVDIAPGDTQLSVLADFGVIKPTIAPAVNAGAASPAHSVRSTSSLGLSSLTLDSPEEPSSRPDSPTTKVAAATSSKKPAAASVKKTTALSPTKPAVAKDRSRAAAKSPTASSTPPPPPPPKKAPITPADKEDSAATITVDLSSTPSSPPRSPSRSDSVSSKRGRSTTKRRDSTKKTSETADESPSSSPDARRPKTSRRRVDSADD